MHRHLDELPDPDDFLEGKGVQRTDVLTIGNMAPGEDMVMVQTQDDTQIFRAAKFVEQVQIPSDGSPQEVFVRVRNAVNPIRTFEARTTLSSDGAAVNVIRSPDV